MQLPYLFIYANFPAGFVKEALYICNEVQHNSEKNWFLGLPSATIYDAC